MRALSIHSFTNQPVRLLRILRYCARMGFKMEQRTADWFALALERKLHQNIPGEAVGAEVRQLAHEDKVAAILKAWENHGLIGAVHEQLVRRHPDYDGLAGLSRVRENMLAAGIRIPSEEAFAPTAFYLLRRLKPREHSSALSRMELRKAEMEAVHSLESSAEKVIKVLRGPGRNLLPKGSKKKGKVAEARATYEFLNRVPAGLLAFIQAEYSQPKALSAIRTFLTKWKPLRAELPAVELETLGLPRGPKFDQVLEDLFDLQLTGKGRNPQDRTKLLRRLAGIKPEPVKKAAKEEKKAKPGKGKKGAAEKEKAPAAPAAAAAAGKGKTAPTAPPAAKTAEPPQKSPARPLKKAAPRRAGKPARKPQRKR
jgi:tRNA nucleotidyltransferase/poly(A) polymerase